MRTKLKILWEKAHGTNVQTVLGQLNPVIRGWANYFRTAVAKEIFNGLDRWMFYKEDRYIRRVHPKKARTGGINTIGADCIWNEMTPGCLATNKQERISSNSVGSR